MQPVTLHQEPAFCQSPVYFPGLDAPWTVTRFFEDRDKPKFMKERPGIRAVSEERNDEKWMRGARRSVCMLIAVEPVISYS